MPVNPGTRTFSLALRRLLFHRLYFPVVLFPRLPLELVNCHIVATTECGVHAVLRGENARPLSAYPFEVPLEMFQTQAQSAPLDCAMRAHEFPLL